MVKKIKSLAILKKIKLWFHVRFTQTHGDNGSCFEYWQTCEGKRKILKVNYCKLLTIIQYLLADFQKSSSLFVLCDELLILHEITNWHHN